MIELSYPSDLKKNTRLIVAVSGGADSVALLHHLHQQGFEQITVAHLDHQLRKSSAAEAKMVGQMAKRLGYAFELRKRSIEALAKKKKENLEAVGRDERYRFFRELKGTSKAKYIVTAHHADDQLETVLFNIVRGCGLDGLAGMQVQDGDLWRPLLKVSKKDLLRYCKHHRLPFVHDESNDDLQMSRNILRKKVIPQLKKMNPQLLQTMELNTQLWTKTRDYFLQRAEDFLLAARQKPRRYDLKAFLSLPSYEQQVTLRTLFEQVHGHKKNLQQSHLEQLLKILRTPVSGKKKEFGSGKVLVRRREAFEIQNC